MKKILALFLLSASVFGAYILSDSPSPNMSRIWSMTLQFYPRILTRVQMETMITTDAVARVIYTCDTNVIVTATTNFYYPEEITNYTVEFVTTNIVSTPIEEPKVEPIEPVVVMTDLVEIVTSTYETNVVIVSTNPAEAVTYIYNTNIVVISTSNVYEKAIVARFPPTYTTLTEQETLMCGSLTVKQLGLTENSTCQQVIDAMVRAGMARKGFVVGSGSIVE